jgi:mRNA interferase MazF
VEGLVRGDIVVIPFPFSDLSSTKKRPALVLALLPDDDVLLCQITSRTRGDTSTIEIGEGDFLYGRLPVASYVRCGKLFAASSSIVERTTGRLGPAKLKVIAETNARIILDEE